MYTHSLYALYMYIPSPCLHLGRTPVDRTEPDITGIRQAKQARDTGQLLSYLAFFLARNRLDYGTNRTRRPFAAICGRDSFFGQSIRNRL